MKSKLLYFLVFLPMMYLSSCSSDENSVSSVKENVTLVSRLPMQEARAAYQVMSAPEKLRMWQEWLAEKKSDPNMTSNQTADIQEVLNQLNLDIFETGENAKKADFMYIFVPSFLDRASAHFTRDEMTATFYETGKVDPTKKKCSCNQGSLFGCSANCEDKSCDSSVDGCGFMWGWECNGVCRTTDL